MKSCKFLFAFFLLGLVLVWSNTSVLAKDEWIRVESKNFHLIGNAGEKDIRKVATKLEQFRETFRILFKTANFDAAIPTNVIVFKSGSAYKPFKPKRADGKIDNFVAGYFQPGTDVNYITLSTDGEDAETYGTIFHEYVHFMLEINFGKSDIPPWFNEGLAEYYQTFAIEKDQEVKLGLFQQGHIDLLAQSQLMPLDTLFNISNYALHQQGNHSRSIFYAQSWALLHYLLQNPNANIKQGLDKFLLDVGKDISPEKAFQNAFQMTYAQMEKELKKYVNLAGYKYQTVTFKQKLTFDTEMKVSPLSETDTNAYLGDLLYHTNRWDDAEPFLQKALALQPNSSMANTTLGMVKFRQKKFDEAKNYLEKAIADNNKNHIAYYYYAFLLSREGRDEFGYASSFNKEKVSKMRDALQKSIAINPSFIESYEMLGFISLVNSDQLDETIQLLKKALSVQPGNQKIILRIAEILSRQEKFDDAQQIAEKIAKTSDEPEIKSRAESLLSQIQMMQNVKARNEASRKQYEEAMKTANNGTGRTVLTKRQAPNQKQPTPEEIAKVRELEKLISINQALKKPASNEKQIIGRITKITCAGKIITYAVKTETGTASVFSKDFQNLALVSFDGGAENVPVGCNANLSAFNSVLTYQITNAPKSAHLGELVAIDFVPNNFRFVDESESEPISTVNLPSNETIETPTFPENPIKKEPPTFSNSTPEDFEETRRNAMMNALKESLPQPQTGEKRELGFIEKVECDDKGMYFFMKIESQLLKLKALKTLQITAHTPDVGGDRFGCGMKQFGIPAVFIYKEDTNPKAKIRGELISIDFVPKSFKLEN